MAFGYKGGVIDSSSTSEGETLGKRPSIRKRKCVKLMKTFFGFGEDDRS